MKYKQANDKLNKNLKKIGDLINECVDIADEHFISFAVPYGDSYYPERPNLTYEEALNLIENSDEISEELLEHIQDALGEGQSKEEWEENWERNYNEPGWSTSSY